MAPPRRVRDEALMLRKPGQADITLMSTRERVYWHSFPSQRRFLVSPDARTLAYSDPQKQLLTLLRRDGRTLPISGVENGEIRFSPSASMFAVVRWVDGKRRIDRVDLAHFEVLPWADLPNVIWMEFCADGLVVLHQSEGSAERKLILLPWSGEARLLATSDYRLSRFVAAKEGSAVVYFVYNEIMRVDTQGGEPEKLGSIPSYVSNAEMSPDGQSVVMATGSGTYRLSAAGEIEQLDGAEAHTIWFSRDGQSFVFAHGERAVWRKGTETRTLNGSAEVPIVATRYLSASPGLLVSMGKRVFRWNPERNETEELVSLDEGQEMLGADVFGGGLVLWVGTPLSKKDALANALF